MSGVDQKHYPAIFKRYVLTLCLVVTSLPLAVHADVNVLIVGSTKDSGERHTASSWWQAEKPNLDPNSVPFSPNQIATELDNILSGAGLGAVNVVVEDRYRYYDDGIWGAYAYDLATWCHFPYPASYDTTNTWPLLRGELTTNWNYIILIGDPYNIEYTPGMYTYGVAQVADEISKGSAETVLLMGWPGSGSDSSVNHYKDVVYRTGRTGGIKVAPAGLAWQAAGSPSGGGHPNNDGAYIAAASIFSRIWEQNAKDSSYSYNDSLADTVYTTVTNNIGAQQYTGSFSFQNPYLMLGDKRRQLHFSERGTSTEQGFKTKLHTAVQRCNLSYNDGSYNDRYASETPEDDGMGWPSSNPMPIGLNLGRDGLYSETNKAYVVNSSYWQLGFGYYYQSSGWSQSDQFIGLMQQQDNDLANRMIAEDPTARNIPVRTLWAAIHKADDSVPPKRDGTHLSYYEDEAVGTYLYTLYSGRCPLDPEPATPDTTWLSRKIGYEMAWRLGRCQTRAPGFKVTPTTWNATNVTPSTTQELSVQFILAPTSTVTVTVAPDDLSVGHVTPNVLTFTPQNYMTPQTVTVAGVTGSAGSHAFDVDFMTSSSDPAYNGVDDAWDFMNTRSTEPAPAAILVRGNGHLIDSGDMTPGPADDTDYGVVASPAVHTFTIENISGSSSLSLTDNPRVSVSGAGGHFVLSQDAASSVAASSSTSFDITYAPQSGGSHTALVSIASSDTQIPVYAFALTGMSPSAPTVSTQGASSGSATTADLSGQLTAGGLADAWIVWGDEDAGTGSVGSWDNSASIGSVLDGETFATSISGLLFGPEYSYRVYVTNSAGEAWSSVTTFTSSRPAIQTGIPGLISGAVSGNIDTTTPNPGNGDGNAITNLGPWRAQAGGWAGDTTYIYTGQMFFDGTDYFFVESIDDQVWLKIDGVVVINDGTWGNVSNSGLISKPAGWYDFELRMSNGGGGSGPVSLNPGFQYHNNGGTSDLEADNWYPEDPGDATLFRTGFVPEEEAVGVTNTSAINISQNTADLQGMLNGTQSVFAVSVYWSTSNNATASAWLADTSASSTTIGSYTNISGQGLSASVSGLSEGTMYYYTLRASNSATNIWAMPNASFTTLANTNATSNHSVPHAWLSGINPSWSNDYENAVMQDPDGDGFFTWEEYWSGTDPMNSNSYLSIDVVSHNGSSVTLEWQHAEVDTGLPDIVIQGTSNLLTGAWLNVGQKAPVDGTNTWGMAPGSVIYYRLMSTSP